MDIGNIIDIVILFFLVVTIFYAWRLSTYMKIFRDSRKDMESLLFKLDADIARAEKSVLGMRNAAENAGMKLNETVKESKFLADELKFMNEAGDNLASRLEKLAEKNRALVDQLESAGGISANTRYKNLPIDDAKDQALPRHFVVRDNAPANINQTQTAAAPDFSSQAERDLYDALHRKGDGR